ncbi:esterase/lipase family protein [Paludisphaera soli]|uniref:esterase/lipase family protein n=1 Tax=Paludisphaera soli TaxID=2712865 RepID=UPI0013E9C0F6|nr:alpha/beta hydrolase [Paludisphaera soli]
MAWLVASAACSGFTETRGEDAPTTGHAAGVPTATRVPIRYESIGLSTPSPYAPGKIPVVLVHGFWIGPQMWAPLIRTLESDPALASKFQFWTFGYASGDPLPYSAYRLRNALEEARKRFDPERRDPAFDRMVLIGHSMGGILAKLAAVDSGDRFWRLASDSPPDRLVGEPGDAELARGSLVFRARPEVRTVVFIATPHRGGTPDQRLLHDVATRLVRPPDPLLKAYHRLIAANPPDFFKPTFRLGLLTSIDQMRWDSPTLAELLALRPPPTVAMHSIIPIKNGPRGPGGDDGLIGYLSAHLDDVASETIVPAGHFCVESPETVARLRAILIEAAAPRPVEQAGFQLAVPPDVR